MYIFCSHYAIKLNQSHMRHGQTAWQALERQLFWNIKTRILVSLCLPRSDTKLNTKAEKTKILLKERFAEQQHVNICDNGNHFYRRDAPRGILNEDGIRLSKTGANKLARRTWNERTHSTLMWTNGTTHSFTQITWETMGMVAYN